MAKRSDEQLMMDFVNGNNEAMEMIYQRYKDKIFGFAYRMTASTSLAEEITSETFLAVIRNREAFDPNYKFSTWIFAIAKNKALDHLRSRRLLLFSWFKRDEEDRGFEEGVVGEGEDPRQALEMSDLQELVQRAVADLPLEQRQAFVLREYNNLSYEEIARIMDVSLSKVKVLIYRARQSLINRLRPFIEEMGYGVE